MSDFNEAFKNMLMCNTTFQQMLDEVKAWADPSVSTPNSLSQLHVLIFRNNVLNPNEKIQLAEVIVKYGAMPSMTRMKTIVLPEHSAKNYKPLIIYYCNLGVPPNLGKYSWEDLKPIIMESRDPVSTAFNVATQMLTNGRLSHNHDSSSFAELMHTFSLDPEQLHMHPAEMLKRLAPEQINMQVIDRLRIATKRTYVEDLCEKPGVVQATKIKIIEYIWTKDHTVFTLAGNAQIRRICEKFSNSHLYQLLGKYLEFGSSAPYNTVKNCARIASGRLLADAGQYDIIDRVILAANIPATDLNSFRVTFRAHKNKLAPVTAAKLWPN
jgi:hypothetical protein